MRARPSVLFLTVIMVVSAVLFGCDEKIEAAPGVMAPPPRLDAFAPAATAFGLPLAPAGQPGLAFDGLSDRVQQATREASAEGAAISVAVLDRATGVLITNGNTHGIATASVAKVFIADDLLLRRWPTADERAELDLMLRSSDDGAAEKFWNQGGGGAIIGRVADRYGLPATLAPPDGAWWNTITTAADLAHYYDMLFSGTGGLPPERAAVIINNLAQATPDGIDGYPQRFGIPDGLYDEPVAVKQGWMCCIGADWMHLSTGVVGADHRYVVVIESLQPSDDATARETITQAVKTMFPGGHV